MYPGIVNIHDKAIDISERLELLEETINDTIEAIAIKVIKKDLERMF